MNIKKRYNFKPAIKFYFLLILILISGNSVFAQLQISNLNDNISFTEGGSAVLIDNGDDASILDGDVIGYNGGTLTAVITSASANENLSILEGVNVTLSSGMTVGSTINISGTDIGTIASTGQSGVDLIINFNADASDANITTLLRNINYLNDSQDPAAASTITVNVTNATPTLSNDAVITVSITGINDPPTLSATGADPTFTENGTAVNIYSSASISTVESAQTIIELKLTITNVINGADEILFIDGTDVALSDGNSLTTATNSMSVVVSLTGNTATITISGVISSTNMETLVNGITYRNENDNPDTNSRVVSIISIKDNGGGSDTNTYNIASTIAIVAVNDRPVLNTTPSPAFAGIIEGLGNPVDGSTDNSVLVSSLIDDGGALNNYSDAEGDLPGIGITAVNSGTIWYSFNDGINWTEFSGTVSETSALVFFADALTRIYYKPNTNVSGTVTNAITIKAWDRTSGQANGTTGVNTTTGTSFSTNTDDVSIEISDINASPVLTATPNNPAFIEGDPPVDLFSSVSFSTVETGQSIIKLVFRLSNIHDGMNEILSIDGSDVGLGIGDSLVSSANGIKIIVTNEDTTKYWTYITLTKMGGFSSAVTQDIIENITYENTSSAPTAGIKSIVVYSAQDNGGTANGGSDTSINLDSSLVTVTGINEAPVLDASKSPVLNGVPENINDPSNGSTLYSTLVSKLVEKSGSMGGGALNNYIDNDNDLPGLAVTSVNAQSTLWYSINDGVNWTELTGTISETSALVLFADNTTRMYYKTDNGVSGTVTDAVTFKAWDRTAGGGNGTSGVNTTLTTAFSSASDNAEITIADINYPPTLSATGLNPTFTEGGMAKDLFSSVSVSTQESGQSLLELKLTITSVINNSDEILSIDGTPVQLTNGNSLISSLNGMTISVSISNSTATLIISKIGGISSSAMQTLIDGITYNNLSNNTGDLEKIVTLISLKDDGGSANGSDTDTYTITSTITVESVNEPPVISNLDGDHVGVVAGGNAENIDDNKDAAVSNPDSPNSYGGSILIVQTSGTQNGFWSVDGTIVQSGSDNVIASGESISVYGISIGEIDASDNGQAGDNLLILFNDNSTVTRITYLLNNLMYAAPSGLDDRNFTLTYDDGDGSLHGGDSDVSVSFTVSLTQQRPVLSGLNGDTHNYAKGGGPIILDENSNAAVTDSDSPNFDTGNLTVSISSGLQAAEDELEIDISGTIALSAGMTNGSSVSVEGVGIGLITLNGSSGNDLVITFNNNSTHVRVNQLLRAITYNNTNSSPSLVTRIINFSIRDASGTGGAESEISTVEVVLNSGPTTIGISDIQVNPNAENTLIDLTLSFDDADEGAAGLSYSVKNISNASLFTTVFVTGSILVIDYGLSKTGSSNITIRATDSGGFYVESTFRIEVGSGETPQPSNSPIVTVNNGSSINEGATFIFTSEMLSAQDVNGNLSNITYKIIQMPEHGLLENSDSIFVSPTGAFSFSNEDIVKGKIKYIHKGDEASSDIIKFTVTDDVGNSNGQNDFIITILNINDAPAIENLSPIIMKEDGIHTCCITNWYEKINDPDNADSTLSISLITDDENMTIITSDNKNYTILPAENYFGTTLLTVVVSDGKSSCETEVSLIIEAVNDLPEITGLPSEITITNGSAETLPLFSYISDLETPDSLFNLSFSTNPDSILFNYKSKTGILTLLAYGTFEGKADLAITVSDADGGEASAVIAVIVKEKEVSGINKLSGIPEEYQLYQNYPNPFNPSTVIRYGLPDESHVNLTVYNLLGQEITVLENNIKNAGYYEVVWNAGKLSSGIYIYILKAKSLTNDIKYTQVKKMLMIK